MPLAQDRIKFYKNELELCAMDKDTERAHIEADNVILDILNEIGLHELADLYDNIGKWYA